ncbi:uncharacterized protein LOC123300480 [Chrysoperla carnea]|uniref:uncharacterized protein LOC123300480 n=1 Tax=Chrysoperla carnea TaxID=189513 RepID=UPI001D0863BE|nr:uncharacterized protein LOC123300480 [Chrysoperla carnea]
MSKKKPKTNNSSQNLHLEYQKLLVFHDSLQDEIKKLQTKLNNNVENTVKIPTVVLEESDRKPAVVDNENTLKELLNALSINESLNRTKFSNEKIQYLSVDENETDIKFKKLYMADCVVRNRTKFQIELIVNENMKNVEVIQSINLKFEDLREATEMSSGLSFLKKKKNVHLLFSAIRQYSTLSKLREEILKSLPKESFETSVENGKQIIECFCKFSKKIKYFICEWSIDWNQQEHNFVQGFEITIEYDDDNFAEAAQPIFDNLCEIVTSIEDAKVKVLQWRKDIVKLIKQYDRQWDE